MRPGILLTLAAFAATAITACGANGSSAVSENSTPVASATAEDSPLPSTPGAVTIGSANFPESELLAYLYAGAMTARGVQVTVHAGIGERPAYLAALNDHSIGAVPEYTGALLSFLHPATTAKTPNDVYNELRTYAQGRDLAVGRYAAAQDVDTITVTRATAARYHLQSIGDLKDVAPTLSLGAPAPFRTVPYGIPALKNIYGVTFGRFVPLPATGSIARTTLVKGTVDAADIFSTDPAIQRDNLISLTDPQNIFAAENVVPVFRRDVLTQPMADACAAVATHLTTSALAGLVTKVVDGVDPAAAATSWLAEEGIT